MADAGEFGGAERRPDGTAGVVVTGIVGGTMGAEVMGSAFVIDPGVVEPGRRGEIAFKR